MESSRRDLSNSMTEHRLILKNNQNTNHARFGFTPITGIAFPKTGFCFYCEPRKLGKTRVQHLNFAPSDFLETIRNLRWRYKNISKPKTRSRN